MRLTFKSQLKHYRLTYYKEKCNWNRLAKQHNLTLWLTNITKHLEKYKSEKICYSDYTYYAVIYSFLLRKNGYHCVLTVR